MAKNNGPWTITGTEQKYKDNFIELRVDAVLKPNGEPGSYATLQMKRGVAILPVDDAGNVYLTNQFRYAINRESIEAVSGGADDGEDLLVAARRELKEELGIEGQAWTDLGFFHLETSTVKGPVYLYVVQGLSFNNTNPDDTEDIQAMKLPLEEAVQKVQDNDITHGPSCVLLLKAFLQKDRLMG